MELNLLDNPTQLNPHILGSGQVGLSGCSFSFCFLSFIIKLRLAIKKNLEIERGDRMRPCNERAMDRSPGKERRAIKVQSQ